MLLNGAVRDTQREQEKDSYLAVQSKLVLLFLF